MTMYLPNPDLHPIGWEPAEFIAAEFIDAHRAGQPGDRRDPRPTDAIGTSGREAS
jgi:hypothetical protein